MKPALVLAAVLALTLTGGCSAGGTTYRTRVVGLQPVSGAKLNVSVRVTNTGQRAGTPDCTVTAQSPGFADTGWDEGSLRGSLAPGQSVVFVMPLTITNQGAAYATQAKATCK